MDRAEKNTEITFLVDSLKRAQIGICADYQGVNVAKITALRKQLGDEGSSARVIKNTLARISIGKAYKEESSVKIKETEVDKFIHVFKGPSMYVYSYNDPITPAKVLCKFKKENENFKIKGAFVDGTYIDAEGVDNLSSMPGKDEILSNLLRLLLAPATNLVRTINAPGSQLVQVLDAVRSKLEV
jgi:large subunit ribosomal protein L10